LVLEQIGAQEAEDHEAEDDDCGSDDCVHVFLLERGFSAGLIIAPEA
jgi:hypothetical protein